MDWELVFRDRKEMAEKLGSSHTDAKHVRFEGDLSPLLDINRPRIAVVGTRHIVPAAKYYINRIVSILGRVTEEERPIVVSGLAIGTDTAVHTAALSHGVPTVAVVATGLDNDYPLQNKGLASMLRSTSGCGILSQFPDGTAPMALNFLERNKTIVMMSDAVIIPAARAKGGSLVIAKIAHEWGIPVYAIPGRPEDIWATGCNDLIRQGIASPLINFEEQVVRLIGD